MFGNITRRASAVMPRVPLSDLYDSLEETDKATYKKLMIKWYDAIKLNNQDKKDTR